MSPRSPQRVGLLIGATVLALACLLAGRAAAVAMVSEPVAPAEPNIPAEPRMPAEPIRAAARSVASIEPTLPVANDEVRCEIVEYTPSTATTTMTGEWCEPPDSVDETVVVLVHGGGGFEGDPEDVAAWREAHLLAGRTTFVIEYTLLDVNTGLDIDAGAAVFPLPEQNVMAATQFARMRTTGDVVLHGFSAGARLAAIVATAADDPFYAGDELHAGVSARVDAAVLFYGYFDGSQFHGDQYFGDQGSPTQASAIGMASPDDAPVLIVHGTADIMTDPAGSVELASVLDAELVLVDGENHVFDGYGTDRLTDAGAALVPVIDDYLDALPE